jgi:hypothetical protein
MRKYYVAALIAGAVVIGSTTGAAQDAQGTQDLLRQGLLASGVNPSGLLAGELDRIIRGYQINPVPLNLRGKDLALVGLGSYNVNAKGGCNDCHTSPSFAPGGDPFMGEPKKINAARYLAGGALFGPPGDPNTPVSRNLTPRASTGLPAGLTYEQFRKTIRTGEDLKHRPPFAPSAEKDLLQVMPWPAYQDMTERDLRAIYEYLRAIPSLPSTP